eukprot:s890_g21.t1
MACAPVMTGRISLAIEQCIDRCACQEVTSSLAAKHAVCQRQCSKKTTILISLMLILMILCDAALAIYGCEFN